MKNVLAAIFVMAVIGLLLPNFINGQIPYFMDNNLIFIVFLGASLIMLLALIF